MRRRAGDRAAAGSEGTEGGLNRLLARIKSLAEAGELQISEHGYDELATDGLLAREVVEGLKAAVHEAFMKRLK